MGDMIDGFRAMREHRRGERERLGIDCPGCTRERPRAHPTRLMPGRICRVCGTTYEQAQQEADTRPHLRQKEEPDA